MKFVNTIGDRLAIEVILPTGKTVDYIEPFGLSYEYSEDTVRDSRDLQKFVMKGILIEEGKEGYPGERFIKSKNKPVEEVGSYPPDQATTIKIGNDEFAGDGSSIVSKAPGEDFAKEKTLSQMAEETTKKVADSLNMVIKDSSGEEIRVGVPKDSLDASKVLEEAGQAGVLSNKDEILSKQAGKIKEAVDKGLVVDTVSGQMIPEDVMRFNKLPYFSKKAEISKITDKSFLGRLLACVKNDAIKALVRIRFDELK